MIRPTSPRIAIIGAGPVGLTLARALAGSDWDIHLFERQAADHASSDPRALALAEGSRQILAGLGAWPASTTAIDEILIDQQGGTGRTRLHHCEEKVPALGYVVRYQALHQALRASLPAGAVQWHQNAIGAIAADHDQLRLTLPGNTAASAFDVVVHAEGSAGSNPAVTVRDYRQVAIIAEVGSRESHAGRAFEHFTPAGPLALLPLEHGWSLVLTVPSREAETLLALDDAAFLTALQSRFGTALTFTHCSPRSAFPLALRRRRQLVEGRQVWIGNAAQTLHPVSGQGFNLGLRDARELSEHLLAKTPFRPGALAAYASSRQLDRWATSNFTDGLVRLFSNDLAPLRLIRGLGLDVLNRCPPARHFLARRMIWGARAWF